MTEYDQAESDKHFSSKPYQLVGHVEAAKVFGVQPSTMARWGRTGKVPTVVLPSGRRKYSLTWCKWAMGQRRGNGSGPKVLKDASLVGISIDETPNAFGEGITWTE